MQVDTPTQAAEELQERFAFKGDAATQPLVERLGFAEDDYLEAGGLSVIRCTIMDPFMIENRGRTDFIEGFATTLKRVMGECL